MKLPYAALYTHDGLTLSISDWAKRQGLRTHTIRHRLHVGYSIAEALNGNDRARSRKRHTINGVEKTLKEWADFKGIKVNTIYRRLLNKWSIEEAVNGRLRKPNSGYKRIPTGRTYRHAGKSLTLRQWSVETGIALGTIRNRVTKGWSIGAALTIAPRAVMGAQSHTHTGGWIKTSQSALGTSEPPSRDIEPKQGIFQ